jgi:hypothetical protein
VTAAAVEECQAALNQDTGYLGAYTGDNGVVNYPPGAYTGDNGVVTPGGDGHSDGHDHSHGDGDGDRRRSSRRFLQ